MVHGGGHIMLSRKDVRPKQTNLLLDNGLLPISIDYRLCPEINILDGPMTDVCDALGWAQTQLPTLQLKCPVKINGDKIVVVGWSTGGHLAMTLAWTAPQRGLNPPNAILAFYCPTDYEDQCKSLKLMPVTIVDTICTGWQNPNFPEGVVPTAGETHDLLEAVEDEPVSTPHPKTVQTLTPESVSPAQQITSYNVAPNKHAVGGWMSPSDPRSRIILHMNWHAQALPILLNGLPSKRKLNLLQSTTAATPNANHTLPQPTPAQIHPISPLAQIRKGAYSTPTFLVHGTADDLIPWRQSVRTHDALVERGVRAGVAAPEGKVHLFDLYRDPDGVGWGAVERGYEFLFGVLGE